MKPFAVKFSIVKYFVIMITVEDILDIEDILILGFEDILDIEDIVIL